MTADEVIWIEEGDLLAIHDRLLSLHGGLTGLRDRGLLQAALARPKQLAAYSDTIDRIGLAAAYAAGLIQNHPFLDGNKRAGFLACVLFLELNGLSFAASEETAAEAVLALAAGNLDEPAFRKFLWENSRAQ